MQLLVPPIYYYVANYYLREIPFPLSYHRKVKTSRYGRLIDNTWIKVWGARTGVLCCYSWKWWPGGREYVLLPFGAFPRAAARITIEDCVMGIKRLSKEKVKATKGYAFEDAAFKKAYPQLYEHFAAMVFDGGEKRELSKLSMFIQDGAVKAFLNEQNEGLSLCVTADSITDLFNVLEAAVGADNAEWRVSPWGKQGKGKK